MNCWDSDNVQDITATPDKGGEIVTLFHIWPVLQLIYLKYPQRESDLLFCFDFLALQ